MFNLTVDAGTGILVRELMASSYYYHKGKLTLPEDPNSYVQNSRYLRALLPEFYQRVGVLDLYLVRRDAAGQISIVVPEFTQKSNTVTNLLKIAEPGDMIAGNWWF